VGDKLVLRARPWAPAWLEAAPPHGVDHDAAAGTEQRADVSVAADPFFDQALHYRAYRSPGQRAALRAVVDAPPASTLAVVLPTGEGKSACFYAAARVGWVDRGNAKGTVVVITPTVALALDHERNAAQYGFEAPQLAYRAGETGVEGLAERLRDGTQGICFASPEAALGPLLPALREAARAGLISALAIDEAHLVDAWGGVFRPDFQFLAGLHRELMDTSPDPKPRTFLLTATLTATAASVLRALFGSPGSALPIVAAPTMRPEHSYWSSGFVEEDTQVRLVDEAVANLPRPLILYATRREDVLRHYGRLNAKGYRRIGWMTGDSALRERTRLLGQWAEGSIDIVVATSAFGLGVNNAEVRTVIHACVPEGIDRFYQEVGRSGRDGRSAISVLIPTEDNLRDGQRLSKQKLITPRKGYERWEQMFIGATSKRGSLDELDIQFDLAPGVDPDRIDMLNEENTKWNLRVVAMMSIAALVSIRRAPRRISTRNGMRAVLTVGIEDMRHRDYATFEAKVEPHRSGVASASQRSMRMMSAYIRGRQCIGEAVAAQYAIPADVLGSETVEVRGTCPGCPACRPPLAVEVRPYSPPHPWPPRELAPGIARLLGPGHRLVILYSEPLLPISRPDREKRSMALARLLRGSFRSVRVMAASRITHARIQSLCGDWALFFASDPVAGGPLPPGPTVVIHAGEVARFELDDRSTTEPIVMFATGVDERYAGPVWQIGDLEEYLLR